MSRRVRQDEPGAWHHVMNRGIARRSIVENRRDARYFLSQLARAIRAGWFEVHAYTILTTHFHMLIKSTTGEMWRGMRRLENGYVRWFNRAHRRDGSLLRGRFYSKRIESDHYWKTVVRYIDLNAVSARISFGKGIYPYCSAYHYARSSGPPWLSRYEVESMVRCISRNQTYRSSDYVTYFGTGLSSVESKLVEARHNLGIEDQASLDDLIGAAPNKVRAWMKRKALLADGTSPGLPIAEPNTLLKVIFDRLEDAPTRQVKLNGKQRDSALFIKAGLLRWACGITFQEIADRLGCSTSTAHQWVRYHSLLMSRIKDYLECSASIIEETISRDWNDSKPIRIQPHQEDMKELFPKN